MFLFPLVIILYLENHKPTLMICLVIGNFDHDSKILEIETGEFSFVKLE